MNTHYGLDDSPLKKKKKWQLTLRNVPSGIQIYRYADYQLPCYTLSLFTMHSSSAVPFQNKQMSDLVIHIYFSIKKYDSIQRQAWQAFKQKEHTVPNLEYKNQSIIISTSCTVRVKSRGKRSMWKLQLRTVSFALDFVLYYKHKADFSELNCNHLISGYFGCR